MKPILLREVHGKIRRLLKQRDMHRENQWLRRELNRTTDDTIVGKRHSATSILINVERFFVEKHLFPIQVNFSEIVI